MSDRDELLQKIKDRAVVHGDFVLSSGTRASWYVDLRRVTLDGAAAPLVGRVMLDETADLDYDAVGGLTLGADPVAAAMLHAAAARGRVLDAFVVRKAGKAHGLQRRIEDRTSGAPRPRRGGHLHHGRVGPDRGGGAAGGGRGGGGGGDDPGARRRRRIAEAGLDYRHPYDVTDLGLD